MTDGFTAYAGHVVALVKSARNKYNVSLADAARFITAAGKLNVPLKQLAALVGYTVQAAQHIEVWKPREGRIYHATCRYCAATTQPTGFQYNGYGRIDAIQCGNCGNFGQFENYGEHDVAGDRLICQPMKRAGNCDDAPPINTMRLPVRFNPAPTHTLREG